MQPEFIEKAKAYVQEHHDNKTALAMRGGYFSETSKEMFSGGCYAGITGSLSSAKHYKGVAYLVFHGAGAPISFDGIRDNGIFNQELAAHKHPWNHFVGTEATKEWITFLLSDESPWRDLLPYLLVKDVDYINNAGFIFDPAAPVKLFYNFAMAIRFPWELPRQFALWRILKETMAPAMALYISNNFELKSSATDTTGPWEIVYPWSFLEESDTKAVGRFVLGKPANINGANSPNVHPLWDTECPKAAMMFEVLLGDHQLKLTTIVDALNTCIESQRSTIEGKVCAA